MYSIPAACPGFHRNHTSHKETAMSRTASPVCPDAADHCPVVWPRAIVLVDMNAFFASIEQRDRPEWRGRPLAVTNGLQGTCIITCSYEARAYGIHTGMRLPEARRNPRRAR